MDAPLPPGVTRSAFEQALRDFAGIVGLDWASGSQADRESYHDAFNPGDPLEFVSGGFVAPASVEEVQAVVKAAGRHGVPLWPVSTGKNLAYGGAAPLVPEPETYLSCEVNCRHDSGLEAFIDTLRPFQLDETIRNPVVVTHARDMVSRMPACARSMVTSPDCGANTLPPCGRAGTA